METPEQLVLDLETASKSLHRCQCGSRVVMEYEPGCAYIDCVQEAKTFDAIADWNPERLATRWNEARVGK